MTQPTFADRDGWIWHNGSLVPWRDAKVHVLTHTLHYGLGVFEGVRAYATPSGTCVFRLHEHTDRLFDSAHILGLTIPYSKEEVNAAQLEVFAANELTEGYLRPLVYLGSEAMGLRAEGLTVNLSVAAWPWPDYMDADSREKGIVVRTSSYTRHHVNITLCKAKAVGNYTNSILANGKALVPQYGNASRDAAALAAAGIGEGLIRVSIGLENIDDLLGDLEKGLRKVARMEQRS